MDLRRLNKHARRIADALEEANELKREEIEQRERLINSQYEQHTTIRNSN